MVKFREWPFQKHEMALLLEVSILQKQGEPIRRAINDIQRKEASILTHTMWMDNPLGAKNCHFLDIINDEIGPHGVSINHEKIIDADAEWNYLEALLPTNR
jgi:hypothetical protein